MTQKHTPVALVTGGSRGLGRDMAMQIAKKGFDVILTYHSHAKAAAHVVESIEALGRKAVALQLDVASVSAYPDFISRVLSALNTTFGHGHLHALVNNAGTGLYAPFENTTETQFDEMVNIHLKPAFFLTQHLLPLMESGGSVVNISSGLARFSYQNYAAYGVMKAAVDSLTRYQALELGGRKIRVNSVAPGAIETDFGGGAVRDNPELKNMIAGMTALGRVGLPDDIGSVVAFLISDEAKWVNAQRIEVTGGVHI